MCIFELVISSADTALPVIFPVHVIICPVEKANTLFKVIGKIASAKSIPDFVTHSIIKLLLST